MDENKVMIPYIVHEGSMTRCERTIKRLWITTIILIFLLVITNVAWLIYESQFEYFEETTVTQDAENTDGDIILNGTGELTINGQRKTDSNKN